MNATEQIARFIAKTRYEDIPRPVLDATRTIILDGVANVAPVETKSQIGSGALPVSLLPSAGLALLPRHPSGGAVEALARHLRALPVPVIGRIEAGRVILDLRCLEDEASFTGQLPHLAALNTG